LLSDEQDIAMVQEATEQRKILKRKLTTIQAIVPTHGGMPDELDHYFRTAQKKTSRKSAEEESVGPRVQLPAQQFYLGTSADAENYGSEITPMADNWEDYVKHAFIRKCVSSPVFEYGVLFSIFLNTLFLIVETQVEVSYHSEDPKRNEVFSVIHLLFFLIFACELGLRIYAYRCSFFQAYLPDGNRNSNRVWNIFDCFIVAGAAVDVTFRYTGITGGKDRFNSVTILRVFRTLRIGNFFRMRKLLPMFSFLRTIVLSIYHSWSLFLWCVISLNVITLGFSVYFTDIAALELQKGKENRELEQYFGSVWNSQLTLLKAVTGGIDWGDLEELLTSVDVGFAFFPFFAYLMFSLIVTMNVFTGIFLDSASQRAQYEKEVQLVRAAHEIFKASDYDNSDKISKSDFRENIHKADVGKFFSAINLDVLQAEAVFDLLDTSNDGFVSYDEFLRGCMRLCGSAKALDLLILSREVTQLFDWLGGVLEATLQGERTNKQLLEALHKQIAELQFTRADVELTMPGAGQ